MGVNLNKPELWKDDIIKSVDMYNDWFIHFAPEAFRKNRFRTCENVELTLKRTNNLSIIDSETLKQYQDILPTLRMSTCPPLAMDRLIGLAGVNKNLVKKMENDNVFPQRMSQKNIDENLNKIVSVIKQLLDPDVFEWLDRTNSPTKEEIHRAASVIADRLCGAITNPIIRNAQEQRQLARIESWLNQRGYEKITDHSGFKPETMPKGTYCFRMNIRVKQSEDSDQEVNIPADVLIMPKSAGNGFPLLIEAKSAGDFTNTNKRRKEEAQKHNQLKLTYKDKARFILFLCGYFNTPYLGYEAGEGIDWVWEHRMDDLEKFGL